MKSDLVESITLDYPDISKNARFEIGDGWYDILRDMFAAVDAYIKENSIVITADDGFSQIKEKYGTLRAYFDLANDEDTVAYNNIDKIINEFERRSTITCEDCGSRGASLRGRSWVQTLCDSCEALNKICGLRP